MLGRRSRWRMPSLPTAWCDHGQMGKYATHMPLFCNLSRAMERTWDSLELRNGSFCNLLDADTQRVYREL